VSLSAKQWLHKIKQLDLPRNIRIMNVCGGHERAISQAGLRGALPKNIELIPGPGCPVCVCPEEDIYEAIQIALHEKVILCAFGDMLRVPVNVPKNEVKSLEQAKAKGADIRAVASPLEVVNIAKQNVDRKVVFFVAGFETTTAPVAAMMTQEPPDNLSLLLSARLTWPAIALLLQSSSPGFDCLVAPGHVATIMGANEWRFVPEQYAIPTAVAGFTSESLLAAFYSTLRQLVENNIFLDNCYPEVVTATGNQRAQQQLSSVLNVISANWRGIGNIAQSGFALSPAYSKYDARSLFADYRELSRKHAGQMPAGCDCASVVLGKIYPTACRLYGRACTPRTPVGPCMVSDEGACRIWWSHVKKPDMAM